MFKVTADNLRENINASVTARDRHMARLDRLTSRLLTSYYSQTDAPAKPSVINHAYEYLANMLHMIYYGRPRTVAASDRSDTPAQQWAILLKHMLNWFSGHRYIPPMMEELACDYLLLWGVAVVTNRDVPGRWDLPRIRPHTMRLSPRHYIVDSVAKTMSTDSPYGPELKGHQWSDYPEAIAKRGGFDASALQDVSDDKDLDTHYESSEQAQLARDRGKIVCWDVWVPSLQLTDEPGYSGAIATVGAKLTSEGISKKTYALRDPQPCMCTPHGPYVEFGAYKVTDKLFPLSPIMAAAEFGEAVNAFWHKSVQDAANRKDFFAARKTNPGDAQTAKAVKHGEVALFDDPDNIQPKTLGSGNDQQLKFNQELLPMLDRQQGLTDVQRGQVTAGDATATEVSTAAAAAGGRVAGLQSRFTRSVLDMLIEAGNIMWHDQSFEQQNIGMDGEGVMGWEGGAQQGQPDYMELLQELSIETYSMQYQSSQAINNRFNNALMTMGRIAPAITQTPFVPWKQLLDGYMESLSLGEAQIDEGMLQQAYATQQAQTAAEAQPQPTGEQQVAAAQGQRAAQAVGA